MRLIGLTGGIATGKSTVAAMLRAKGAAIIDADAIARKVVQPGTPGFAAIAQRFPEVIDPDGTLNRERLGRRIFHNEGDRAALNAMVHPLIANEVFAQAGALAEAGTTLAIYDVPLLFENGLEGAVDGVLVVDAPPHVQKARLMARNGLSDADAQARINSQWPLAEKKKRARWVIDNGDSLAATAAQVDALWSQW